jgi:hypothetical protein
VILTALFVAAAAPACPAIEMFTYFGDGSRIGLPSLEVPIEAYPGIPLRSDRLRARRRAQAAAPAAAAGVVPPGVPRGMVIRALPPSAEAGAVAPSPRRGPVPIAPDPDDILAVPARPTGARPTR